MAGLAWALAQTGGRPPAALLVALALGFAVLAVFALRGLVDWLAGPDRRTGSYRLGRVDGELALVEPGKPHEGALVGLDGDAMRALVDLVDARNEMRLHAVRTPDGERRSYPDWRADADREPPTGLVVEDSKGLVELDASGRVTARPPIDEAVRGDLVEVLERVLPPGD